MTLKGPSQLPNNTNIGIWPSPLDGAKEQQYIPKLYLGALQLLFLHYLRAFHSNKLPVVIHFGKSEYGLFDCLYSVNMTNTEKNKLYCSAVNEPVNDFFLVHISLYSIPAKFHKQEQT